MTLQSGTCPRTRCALSLESLESRLVPALNVPSLSSLPSAPAALYLDFDGHYQSTWGTYRDLRTSAFDLDGNPSDYSGSERNAIRDIWQRVAEDFAPFNLNVTTTLPSSFADRRALRVAIGSTNEFPSDVGGMAYVDAFTNDIPNVVYVFPNRLANSPSIIAAAVAHEAGHGFGLRHQSQYDGAGRKINDYHPGNHLRAPIMGHGYDAQRNVWWSGPNDRSASSIQDDMALLARSANGFGYRADDHGDGFRSASPLSRTGTSLRATGLIGRTTDQDWFTFTTGGGSVSLSVQVASTGSNLDAVLEIHRVSGSTTQRVATSAPGHELGASVSVSLSAGTYYAIVKSQGAYGDVGTYTLTGSASAGNQASSSRAPAIPSRPDFSGLTSPWGGGRAAAPAVQAPAPDPAAMDLIFLTRKNVSAGRCLQSAVERV